MGWTPTGRGSPRRRRWGDGRRWVAPWHLLLLSLPSSPLRGSYVLLPLPNHQVRKLNSYSLVSLFARGKALFFDFVSRTAASTATCHLPEPLCALHSSRSAPAQTSTPPFLTHIYAVPATADHTVPSHHVTPSPPSKTKTAEGQVRHHHGGLLGQVQGGAAGRGGRILGAGRGGARHRGRALTGQAEAGRRT